MEWYLKSGKQGHRGSQSKLGRLYHAEGDKRNALKWFQRAAEQGVVKACHRVAQFYSEGKDQDYEKAFKYYLIAAERGDTDAQRMVSECLNMVKE